MQRLLLCRPSLLKHVSLSPRPSALTFEHRFASSAGSSSQSVYVRLQRLATSVNHSWQTLAAPVQPSQDSASPATKADKQPKLHLSRLLHVARPERNLIAFALGAQLVSASSMMVFPYALGHVVDAVTGATSTDLDTLVMGMGGVFAVSAIASATRIATMSLAGSRISRTLRTSLFHSILTQETAFFDRRQSGELVNRLSSDVPLVSRTLTDNVAKILRSAVTCATSLGFTLYLSPKLSLLSLCSIPPILASAVVFGRAARRLSKELVDALAAATQVAAERTSAIRTVRMFGGEEVEAKRYAERVDDTYNLAKKVAAADGLYSGALQLSAQISLCGVLWVGGGMVSDLADPMTIGGLTSFSMYAVNLGVSVSGMGTAYGQLTRALGAGQRIFEVIDREPKGHGSTIRRGSSGETLEAGYDATVKFENVHFEYPTQPDTPVLNGVDLTAHPGEVLAIAGASGSGKSTYVNLLARLYEPTRGRILLGDRPITDLDIGWLRQQVAVVAQEPVLFNASVADNIRYGMTENVSDAEVEAAAVAAGSHDMIMSLPEQYDTAVGERGASLSGGQRARIALCRALVRQPRVMVLDEHSAALDSEAGFKVAQAVNNAAARMNMVVVMIAHRSSSLRRAHRVAVLADGVVVECAPFMQLMQRKESYLRRMLAPAV